MEKNLAKIHNNREKTYQNEREDDHTVKFQILRTNWGVTRFKAKWNTKRRHVHFEMIQSILWIVHLQ